MAGATSNIGEIDYPILKCTIEAHAQATQYLAYTHQATRRASAQPTSKRGSTTGRTQHLHTAAGAILWIARIAPRRSFRTTCLT